MTWEMPVGIMLKWPWKYPRKADMMHTHSTDGASAMTQYTALGLLMTTWAMGAASTVMQKKLDRVNSNIQECLQNVRVIKSFVRGDYEEKRFFKSNGDLKESSLRAFKIVILQMPLVAFFMNVTTLAVVWLGGQEVLAGDMQVGNLTAFTTYIVQVLMSLMMLAMVFLQSSRAIASAKRINEILDTEIYDRICTVAEEEAFEAARLLARREGILTGISSGAALHAAIKEAMLSENEGKTIVALLPDTGERYLSTPLFQES